MFDFEKLAVYSKAKLYNRTVSSFLKSVKIDHDYRDQLKRASFSIMLNIAEGSGRFTKPDKRNFYIIARGSAFERVSILDDLKDEGWIGDEHFGNFYSALGEISKMLFSMIKGPGINSLEQEQECDAPPNCFSLKPTLFH